MTPHSAGLCWLKLETAEGHSIVEKIFLHQVYQVMLAETRLWVTRHQPAKLQEAIWLLENFMDATTPKGPSQTGQGLDSGTRRQLRARPNH